MAASAEPSRQAENPPAPAKGSLSLWLWVGGGFLLMVLAWVVLFSVARSAKVESVPMAPKEVRP